MAPPGVQVQPVEGPVARSRFVDVPFKLFKGRPGWVPPLRMTVRDRISPRHPANVHQSVRLWMARRGGRAVGRIGACVDSAFNEFQGLSWAWVGFFEAVDDAEVAQALFEAAWSWSAEQGATACVGPASFTTNDEIGLLVEGFEEPPMLMTPYNPPYYEALWAKGGWEPSMDLWAWMIPTHERRPTLSGRQQAALDRSRQAGNLRVRDVNMKDFDAEVARFFDIYKAAWARNWGFAPMTDAEVRHLARDLKLIIKPELAFFVENGSGEAVAAALALPDINVPMRKIRSGRLLPVGWWHLLRGLRHIDLVRVLLLGVRPEYESMAVGPLMYNELVERVCGNGYKGAEASWTLATNHRVNSAAEHMGGYRYKTWRLYEHTL